MAGGRDDPVGVGDRVEEPGGVVPEARLVAQPVGAGDEAPVVGQVVVVDDRVPARIGHRDFLYRGQPGGVRRCRMLRPHLGGGQRRTVERHVGDRAVEVGVGVGRQAGPPGAGAARADERVGLAGGGQRRAGAAADLRAVEVQRLGGAVAGEDRVVPLVVVDPRGGAQRR